MKQLRKYCIGMLLLVTLLFVTACGSGNNNANNTETNNAGTAGTGDAAGSQTADNTGGTGMGINDILFDTDGDGVYDHADVDGDGLLEEIGRDANDVVADTMDDLTGEGDSLTDGLDGAIGADNGNGAVTP